MEKNEEIIPPLEDTSPNNIIKHIVISGGGTVGFSYLGILSETNKTGWWKIENIKSIYATSVGTICGLLVALKMDWEIIIEYFKNRPWETLFTFNTNILSYFYRKGILGKNVIYDMFEPLFKVKDISQEITMIELYNITGIDFHCFITDFTSFELLDISHKTHPDWKVLDVIYCSCCVPVLFEPFFKENRSYIDGGFFCNYPAIYCLNGQNAQPDEILLLNIDLKTTPDINEETNIFEYILHLIELILIKLQNTHRTVLIGIEEENKKQYFPYEIILKNVPKIYELISILRNKTKRIELIQNGEEIVKKDHRFAGRING